MHAEHPSSLKCCAHPDHWLGHDSDQMTLTCPCSTRLTGAQGWTSEISCFKITQVTIHFSCSPPGTVTRFPGASTASTSFPHAIKRGIGPVCSCSFVSQGVQPGIPVQERHDPHGSPNILLLCRNDTARSVKGTAHTKKLLTHAQRRHQELLAVMRFRRIPASTR
jgi:hypothetical protein